jgi:hypothetical protein
MKPNGSSLWILTDRMFQFASNLKYIKHVHPLRPRTGTLVLAGGTGSLKKESTLHLYNWLGGEFDFVYTLLEESESYAAYEGVLPSNVYALNHSVLRLGETGALVSGNRLSSLTVDVAVFSGYPRRQQVPYAPVNVFQRGVEWTAKNGVVCLANDARHLLFDPARVVRPLS